MDNAQTAYHSLINEAIDKFHALNEDLPVTQEILRRIFFEALRSNPTMLTSDEVERVQSVADLLAAVFDRAPQP